MQLSTVLMESKLAYQSNWMHLIVQFPERTWQVIRSHSWVSEHGNSPKTEIDPKCSWAHFLMKASLLTNPIACTLENFGELIACCSAHPLKAALQELAWIFIITAFLMVMSQWWLVSAFSMAHECRHGSLPLASCILGRTKFHEWGAINTYTQMNAATARMNVQRNHSQATHKICFFYSKNLSKIVNYVVDSYVMK